MQTAVRSVVRASARQNLFASRAGAQVVRSVSTWSSVVEGPPDVSIYLIGSIDKESSPGS
ncbi:hypothetical protein TWF730_006508 [Orbilia blumenaviensis]|uniref:Uncharacterized protein n=1 Tax=Orbilia blumenaviensis TaxID=1796055 RepID=A0AAV9VEI2_9PEZI